MELANRFLWSADRILPIYGANLTGTNYVDTEVSSGRVPATKRFYNTATSAMNHPYLPGDIVSFTGDGAAGHVAVVINSTFKGSGTYSVTLMEENSSSTGETTASVTGWVMGHPADSSLLTPYDFLTLPSAGTWGTAQQVPGIAALNQGGNATITSVSCASAGNCSGGGSYLDASDRDQAFVVSQFNGTWETAGEVPGTAALNQGGIANVASVSCGSAGNCSAGGYYTDNWAASRRSSSTRRTAPGAPPRRFPGPRPSTSTATRNSTRCHAPPQATAAPAGSTLTARPSNRHLSSTRRTAPGAMRRRFLEPRPLTRNLST